MFKNLFQEEVQRIKSSKDLQDGRARRIAEEYGLDMRKILPSYLELTKEAAANDGKVNIDLGNPITSVDICKKYIKKAACVAVVGYELTVRESVQFPVTRKLEEIGVGREAFLTSIKLQGNICRVAPVQVYEELGLNYEKAIEILEGYPQGSLDKILEE